MVIRDIREESTRNGTRLSANIVLQSGSMAVLPLWMEFESPAPVLVLPRGDAFLAAALPIAMKLGEPLHIEAPLSPVLMDNAQKILDILGLWIEDAKRIDLQAPIQDEKTQATGVGCFFSCGVDSFYSLLKHRQSITRLITVHGFDIYLDNPSLFEQLRASTSRVADAIGVVPIWVKTNIREISDQFVGWGLYHGAAAASVALALQSNFATCIIASTYSYANLSTWGSHPLLDPLWSTGNLTIVHDGCESSRVTKVAAVAEHPVAMETLRVCWKDPNSYNCGKCEKCLRTMLELYVCGSLEKCKTLPAFLTPQSVAEIPIVNNVEAAFLREVKIALGSSEIDRAYNNALECALSKWERHHVTVEPEIAALKSQNEKLMNLNAGLSSDLSAIRNSLTWRYGIAAGGVAKKVLGVFGH